MTDLLSVTKGSVKVLRYLAAYVGRHGYSPTVREICRAMEWASPNAAQGQIARLVRAGMIEHHGSRTAKVTPRGQQLLDELEVEVAE
jgi:SOS-response transcriptional repressor LexA